MKPVAYSYLRWSKVEQGAGDSARRQSVATDICESKGWILDTSLRLRDEGVSGFRGKNRKVGALKEFLDAVEDGRVRPGSVLIIEDIDRLSREDIPDVLPVFMGLITSGITIYVVRTEREYNRATMAEQPFIIMEALLSMILANEESKKKKFRSDRWWEGRREGAKKGKPMTGVCPAWLRLDKDKREWVEIPYAVATVKRVCAMILNGDGLQTVVRKLVRDGVSPIGKKGNWMKSYIHEIVRNRELIGEFQPHIRREGKRVKHGEPIQGYFPAVLTETEFDRMQVVLTARKRQTGPVGVGVTNLFTGILYWAEGGTMNVTQSIVKGVKVHYLASADALEHGKGKRVCIPYPAFEKCVLRCLREIPADSLNSNEEQNDIEQLQTSINERKDRIASIQTAIEGDDDCGPLIEVLTKVNKQKRELEEQLAKLKMRRQAGNPVTLVQTQTLVDALASVEPEEVVPVRTRLRTRIKELVERITARVDRKHKFDRRVFVKLEFHAGYSRSIWFDIKRGALDDYGLVTEGGMLNADDMSHFLETEVPPEYRPDEGPAVFPRHTC